MTKEQAITKQMIQYCENRQKEVPELKGGYYQRIKDSLLDFLFPEKIPLRKKYKIRSKFFIRKVREDAGEV